MRKTVLVLMAVLALAVTMSLSCKTEADTTQVTKKFTWTSPGDDGAVGTATTYDFRYSTDSAALVNNWNSCTVILGMPTPKIAGTRDSIIVTLTLENSTRYYFGMKAADEVPNWSLLSNIVMIFVPDDKAPLRVSDLTVE